MSNDNPTPDIKIVVTDIDGTLLNSKHELSERNKKAIAAASAAGATIVLATGKTPGSAGLVAEQLGVPAYRIVLQGLMIFDPSGTLASQQTLRPETIRRVTTFAEDRGFDMLAYSGNRVMARRLTQLMRDLTEPYHEPVPEVVGPLQNHLWTTPIHKIIALGDPRAILSLRWQLNAQLDNSAKLVQAGIPEMLEILPAGTGKATAVKMLLKELKIDPENMLAIGDAENDMEMIQLAGVGIAMGNADEKTKAAAKHVVGTNDEDGLAEAIERFVLPPPAPAAAPEPAAPAAEETKETPA